MRGCVSQCCLCDARALGCAPTVCYGLLTRFAFPPPPTHTHNPFILLMKGPLGVHLDYERSSTWDMKWSKDNPDLFCFMEKAKVRCCLRAGGVCARHENE